MVLRRRYEQNHCMHLVVAVRMRFKSVHWPGILLKPTKIHSQDCIQKFRINNHAKDAVCLLSTDSCLEWASSFVAISVSFVKQQTLLQRLSFNLHLQDHIPLQIYIRGNLYLHTQKRRRGRRTVNQSTEPSKDPSSV